MKVTEEKVIIEDDVITIKAKHTKGNEWYPYVNVLCTITDTGNGFIVHSLSYSPSQQDHYICMDYCEADYIVKGLKKYFKKQRKDRENAS